MRRVTLIAALIAAAYAPAAAQAHDGGHHVDKAALLVTPITPGLPTMNVSAAAAPGLEYVGGENGFTGGHSVIEGDRLYVGAYGIGMRIFDISNPADPQQVGRITRNGARADAPPDAIDAGDRNFTVLNGTSRVGVHNAVTTTRTEWFDVTDPASPQLLSTFLGSADGESHNGDIIDSRRLWIPSGGSGANGLRIYDISPTLTTPASECTPVENTSDASDGSGNPCAPKKLFGGNPLDVWRESPSYPGAEAEGHAFTHTHDVEVYTDYPVEGLGERDILLLAEGGNYINDSGDTGSIFVIDITNPGEPVVLFRWLHERGAGHHPIRYHHEIQFVDGEPGVVLVTDEDLHNGCGAAGGVVALRLAPDLQSATELSEWFIPLGTPAPVCSVHVFSSKRGYVFFGSYNAGLQIVDYNDPSAPQHVGGDAQPGSTAWGALYHDGYVYVGDMTRGLDVYEFDVPGGEKEKKPKKPKKPKKNP